MQREINKGSGVANGKLIVCGEHVVVYGAKALALPIRRGIIAKLRGQDKGQLVSIPSWNLQIDLAKNEDLKKFSALSIILDFFKVSSLAFSIEIESNIPQGMGLGASAALAVAIIRAFDNALHTNLSDEEVNRLAFRCEDMSHGRASGIDNTVACYGKPIIYRRDDAVRIEPVTIASDLNLVIALSEQFGSTYEMVEKVRSFKEKRPGEFDSIKQEIDTMCGEVLRALQQGDEKSLGRHFERNHQHLVTLGVSHPKLEALREVLHRNGALGSKLSGAGGGGAILAIAQKENHEIFRKLQEKGFDCFALRCNFDDNSIGEFK